MKRNVFIIILIILISGIFYFICSGQLSQFVLSQYRSWILQMPEDKMSKDLYIAVYSNDTEWVKKLIEKGVDPNYCKGECGWVDSNPLNVISESFDGTYISPEIIEEIRNTSPNDPINDSPIHQQLKYEVENQNNPQDIHVLNLLVEAGADINRRPYIWDRVNLYNNNNINKIKKKSNSTKSIEIKKEIECFIKDSNRLIEAFLKVGANPDMKGHPFPFSSEGMYTGITDEKAKEYFAKGSRAINVAIEKGIVWESQVDLLMKYTKLDEESLKAAERSGDPKMIEKIKKLWKEQNDRK